MMNDGWLTATLTRTKSRELEEFLKYRVEGHQLEL